MTAVTPAPACLSVLDGLVDWERSRRFHGGEVKLDPGRFEALLAGLPPLPWPRVAVHVAGSEGKTSLTETLAAGLSALGLPTGAYTSPHLRDVRERFRIDGAFVDDAALEAAVERVRAAAGALPDGPGPTWFEFVTALARVLFTPPRVEAAVWETGLGGRLDATRSLRADLAVITSISLEHTAVLGDSVEAIAAEKAGILRLGAPLVVSTALPGPARAVIEARARELGCPVHEADDAGQPLPRRRVVLAARVLDVLADLGLVPRRDARLDAVLEAYRPAGRLSRRGDVLYDGAHSVRACELLAAHLAPRPDPGGAPPDGVGASVGAAPEVPAVGALVFGATAGRDGAAMARALLGVAPRVLLTRAPGERGLDPQALAAALGPGGRTRVEVVDDPLAALDAARRQLSGDEVVLVTGSLHLVGLLWPAGEATIPPSPGLRA